MSPAKAKAAGASISSAISGAFSNLASGVEDSILASLQGASGALGEGKYKLVSFHFKAKYTNKLQVSLRELWMV